jgi:galactose oxidase
MGVLLQGFFKLQGGRALPSPADGNPAIPWWWDHLAAQARALSLTGFTAIWLPPLLKTASGSGPGADGYGPFDDYDIGSRNQKGSTATRYGTREQLQRCVATLRANGLDVYLDMVEHQRVGDVTPFVFRYPGATGTPNVGRFPKNPSNFVPQVPRDPNLGGPIADDFPFGRELAPINGQPPHYVFDNLIAAGDWLTRALDAQGYRIDDVKGLSTDFLHPFLTRKAMAGKFAVGEFFDGNPTLVNQWIFNPRGMAGRSNAFDFPLKFMLNSMCNNPGRFNMADLDHAGLVGISPLNAVTFVENHDTDLNGGQRIVTNKMMGYAYILTSEGYPAVFYKDYSTDRECYGLKPHIDNLIWIHEVLAAGETLQRWKDFDVFAYERMGGPHLLVALNNDPAGSRTIRVDTGFDANVELHDYTGHAGDITTDGSGAVTLTVPPNRDGLGYVCYSRQGQDRPLNPASHAVTQDFEGAEDLDIPPCVNDGTVPIGKIWCAAGSPIEAVPRIDRTAWTANTRVEFELLDLDGAPKAAVAVTLASPGGVALRATAAAEGFHALRVTASGLPGSDPAPRYKLSVGYRAPRDFSAAQPVAADSAMLGQWSAPFALNNVAIHAHLLPTGKILYWGRRKEFGSDRFATLNDHACQTYILDPDTQRSRETANQPLLKDSSTVNLFCSGHTFLPDGRLMVAGGHLFDSQGVNQSCIYDPSSDRWTAEAEMNKGRWYPSVITLPDGGALVLSGSFATGPLQPPTNASGTNPTPQVWRGAGWESLVDFPAQEFKDALNLFPRFHIEPKRGQVFMSGPQGQSFFLDPTGPGTWSPGPSRSLGLRDYAPSVMYDAGKIIFIGGGNDPQTNLPTDGAETIDLTASAPAWHTTSPMHFRRRQHNATILADGTVLVTGATQGPGFNDVDAGSPIHAAELWDPATGNWTVLAEEAVDRCYHSTAVLLPDGRVFSAGGGEYAPQNNVANPPKDTHSDAQFYSPPYLFRGPRPTFTGAPDVVSYGHAFKLGVPRAAEIVKVTWIRLASVTHSFDQNQRLNTLAFTKGQDEITVTAPANANLCPPGHYMLFLVDDRGVPSIGHIARISAPAPTATTARVPRAAAAFNEPRPGPQEVDAETVRTAARPPVVVGITPTCPYGLAGCWGGAKGALLRLTGVETVLELANAFTSTATMFLADDRLPDLDLWRREFSNVANASYSLRGVEMTISGPIEQIEGHLWLLGNADRPAVRLAPLDPGNKVQWDFATKAPLPLEPQEASAYASLQRAVAGQAAPALVTVTGTLLKDEHGFYLEVRAFTL